MQNRILAIPCLVAACVLAMIVLKSSSSPSVVVAAPNMAPDNTSAPAPYAFTYSKDGDLTPPLQYREWIYLTSGLDMSYTAKPSDMSMFDNVFVNPEAYRSFLATGTWPDKTVLVLETRGAGSKSSINKAGHFQSGSIMGLELHVKDESRSPGKWAFFDVASETKATLIPQKAPCYTCHQEHAVVDTTFVQFYPTLLPVARQKATLSPGYLKETADESVK